MQSSPLNLSLENNSFANISIVFKNGSYVEGTWKRKNLWVLHEDWNLRGADFVAQHSTTKLERAYPL